MKYSILKRKDQQVELAKLACCFDLFCKMDTDNQATAIMKWLIDNGFRVPNKEALKNWLDRENKCEPFYYNVYKIYSHLCCNVWTFKLYGLRVTILQNLIAVMRMHMTIISGVHSDTLEHVVS